MAENGLGGIPGAPCNPQDRACRIQLVGRACGTGNVYACAIAAVVEGLVELGLFLAGAFDGLSKDVKTLRVAKALMGFTDPILKRLGAAYQLLDTGGGFILSRQYDLQHYFVPLNEQASRMLVTERGGTYNEWHNALAQSVYRGNHSPMWNLLGKYPIVNPPPPPPTGPATPHYPTEQQQQAYAEQTAELLATEEANAPSVYSPEGFAQEVNAVGGPTDITHPTVIDMTSMGDVGGIRSFAPGQVEVDQGQFPPGLLRSNARDLPAGWRDLARNPTVQRTLQALAFKPAIEAVQKLIAGDALTPVEFGALAGALIAGFTLGPEAAIAGAQIGVEAGAVVEAAQKVSEKVFGANLDDLIKQGASGLANRALGLVHQLTGHIEFPPGNLRGPEMRQPALQQPHPMQALARQPAPQLPCPNCPPPDEIPCTEEAQRIVDQITNCTAGERLAQKILEKLDMVHQPDGRSALTLKQPVCLCCDSMSDYVAWTSSGGRNGRCTQVLGAQAQMLGLKEVGQ